MKLCSTLGSPYGRIARIVRLEKGLEDRVSFEVVRTRIENNPYYDVNPSGRVPSLVLEDRRVLEESTLICWYFDNIDGNPTLHPADGMLGLEARRIEAMARSMLDGTSLWWREYLYRPPEIRSDKIIKHERQRAMRLADIFEKEVQNEILSGPLNMAQITLACVFHGREDAGPDDFLWQERRTYLRDWVERIGHHTSIQQTVPAHA
ncbi:MAG: putative GST-like protein YibF [Alphaproteobacteria bacterium MarineAlpha10_Bin2]|nr:MAG: putative GST-like protein YibF [Alphaproteobacteria bacterium MarineAlpha10_Bin2]HIM46937.1 hypothetical protein [Alphaproteobacteria bacterium]